MNQPICHRRDFLAAGSVAAAAAFLPRSSAAETPAKPIRKAVKIGMVKVEGTLSDKLKLLKRLGYDGVELNAPNEYTLDEVLRARDDSGLPIHGVVDSAHWKQPLSDADPAVRSQSVEALRTAIRNAKDYGATSVLVVPAVVNKDVTYAEAYERSQAEIRKALPLAEELDIRVLFENVWNNFLLSPLETARYIDEFESPAVGAYFDVGNVVRFGWPEHWIRTLGPRIGKLDIKEFSRAKSDSQGMRAGFGVELLEGDCDWPAVMRLLKEMDYTGWGTAEVPGGDEARLADIAARMDKIFALYG